MGKRHFAKVSHDNEMFWVRDVKKTADDKLFVGVVDNQLSSENEYAYGDEIEFDASKVVDYMLVDNRH